MTKPAIKTPSSLSFVRRLAPSDAIMRAGNWGRDLYNEDGWTPIHIVEKSVRGTISNRLPIKESSDPAKMKHKIDAPNLQRIDAAALPLDCDTLRLTFTLRVLPGVAEPATCNDQIYQKHLTSVINDYIEREGMRELARRYAHNIASGRFLWRNRVGYENLTVRVICGEEEEWNYSSDTFVPGDFETGDIDGLDQLIATALAGEKSLLLTVDAYAQLGAGQPVFPSQELILDSKKEKGSKGTTLYSVNDCAAMHSQKIGNAIRSIDTWHGDEDQGAIAVEPYGSVTSRGIALRTASTKTDFYTLLDNWMTKGKVPAIEQQHYVVAMLARGGVFGEKGE
ncbi:type I-F CRISPR-associated protein Csy3 [Salmonella enterica subsp. enterica serovar Nigeria]|nr:type I-F CRISPR-associated protein Csy3 [Salmonella enterica subsp. enterica serovar Nigeria]